MSYEFLHRPPTPAEHRLLAESVGWGHGFAWDAMPASLAASFAGVVVLHEGGPVAMGRVVGDGAYYFYVQDVAVLPGHQHAGLGRRIVQQLVAEVARVAPPKAFIGLFATNQAVGLYDGHGFAQHPGMTGMFRVVPAAEPAVSS